MKWALRLPRCSFPVKKYSPASFKVKYAVTGTSVSHSKSLVTWFINHLTVTFSETRDTTFYQHADTVLKSGAKATTYNDLIGSIYVTGVLKVTDNDAENKSKTEVKKILHYQIINWYEIL